MVSCSSLRKHAKVSLLTFAVFCCMVIGEKSTFNRNSKQRLWSPQLYYPSMPIPKFPQQQIEMPPATVVQSVTSARNSGAGVNREGDSFSFLPHKQDGVYEWPHPSYHHHQHHHQATYCPKCPKCPTSAPHDHSHTTTTTTTSEPSTSTSTPKCPDPCPGTSEPAILESIIIAATGDCSVSSLPGNSNFLKCSRVTAAPYGKFGIVFQTTPVAAATTIPTPGSTAVIGIIATCPNTKVKLLGCETIPMGYTVSTQNNVISNGAAQTQADNLNVMEENFMLVQVSQLQLQGVAATTISCKWQASN